MWIDSHCHLNHERLLHLGGPEKVIDNARAADVSGMMTVCCRIGDEFEKIRMLASGQDNIWGTVGTHPHDAGDPAEDRYSASDIARLARESPEIVAIGETGLDYYYKNSTPESQESSFRKHLQACLEADLPVVVHSRDAEPDTMRIIREEGAGTSLTGVMHCFSSKRVLAEQALEAGFYISFSGIVTFKKSEELRDMARAVPLDRILIETDAPYLAPEPHRKKINEPALMVHTGILLADLYNLTREEFAKKTRENFFKLFPKAYDTYTARIDL